MEQVKLAHFKIVNNNGADKVALIRQLICIFVVCMYEGRVFSRRASYKCV